LWEVNKYNKSQIKRFKTMIVPSINELKIDDMLTKAEITVGILRVVHGLHLIEDYTKENAAQDLIKLLSEMGYLDEPLEIKKEIDKNDQKGN
jgi:hypothetical protein